MSGDEQLATLIRDALSTTIEAAPDDPLAIERVGHGVGAALGETGPDPESDPGTADAEPRLDRADRGRASEGAGQQPLRPA